MITLLLICKLTLIATVALASASKNFKWVAFGSIPVFVNTVMQIAGISTPEMTEMARTLFYICIIIHLLINKKHKEDAQEILELLIKNRRKK